MARHDQKPKKAHMTCSPCHNGRCDNCVDVARFLLGCDDRICQCTKQNHDGEAVNSQILDPSTGTVYAPGLKVDIDGKVTRYARRSD
jgi:hypothetical protein